MSASINDGSRTFSISSARKPCVANAMVPKDKSRSLTTPCSSAAGPSQSVDCPTGKRAASAFISSAASGSLGRSASDFPVKPRASSSDCERRAPSISSAERSGAPMPRNFPARNSPGVFARICGNIERSGSTAIANRSTRNDSAPNWANVVALGVAGGAVTSTAGGTAASGP